jgi:hypothetical protein
VNDTNGTALMTDIDVEAQNGAGSKPPPYTTTESASAIDAPQVTPDGDDMVISFPGWRVMIKKS